MVKKGIDTDRLLLHVETAQQSIKTIQKIIIGQASFLSTQELYDEFDKAVAHTGKIMKLLEEIEKTIKKVT